MAVVVPSLAAALVGLILPALRSWKSAAPVLAIAAAAAWGVSGHWAPALIVLAVGAFAFEAAAALRNVRAGDAAAIAAAYAALALAFGGLFLVNPINEWLAERPNASASIDASTTRLLRVNPYVAIATSLGRDPLRQPYLYANFHTADYAPPMLPRWHETAILFAGVALLCRLFNWRRRAA